VLIAETGCGKRARATIVDVVTELGDRLVGAFVVVEPGRGLHYGIWAATLRAEGMDLPDVQERAGHTSAKTTVRYAMVRAGESAGSVGCVWIVRGRG
jgi:hypothetical protein